MQAIQTIAAFPFVALGWMAGAVVSGWRFCLAAVVMGYKRGRGLWAY